MKRALLASVALHAGLAGAVLLHRAIPPAEPPVTEGVALVMLEVEEAGSESAAAAPPGDVGPAEAMPPEAPQVAEPLEPPPPEPPPLAAFAEAPPEVVPPQPLALPPPPPAPALAELPPPPPEAAPPAALAEAVPPPPEPAPVAEAPPPPPQPLPPNAERPRPPQPAPRPQQAARPPAPPRDASIREAALRFTLPGAEGTEPQAAPGGAARVEGATTTPAAPDQRNPTPPYPTSSRLAGREGSVAVRIEIGADGTVTHVALTHSAGDQALDDAALTTIRRWRFRPATRNGQQVAATVTTNVHFRLDGRR